MCGLRVAHPEPHDPLHQRLLRPRVVPHSLSLRPYRQSEVGMGEKRGAMARP